MLKWTSKLITKTSTIITVWLILKLKIIKWTKPKLAAANYYKISIEMRNIPGASLMLLSCMLWDKNTYYNLVLLIQYTICIIINVTFFTFPQLSTILYYNKRSAKPYIFMYILTQCLILPAFLIAFHSSHQ